MTDAHTTSKVECLTEADYSAWRFRNVFKAAVLITAAGYLGTELLVENAEQAHDIESLMLYIGGSVSVASFVFALGEYMFMSRLIDEVDTHAKQHGVALETRRFVRYMIGW